MQDAVPPKVLELSERNQLGEFVRCHRGPTFWKLIYGDVLASLVISPIFGLALSYINTRIWNIHTFFLLYLLIFSCLLFLIQALNSLLNIWINGRYRQRIYEFAEGCIVTGRRVRKIHMLFWKDLSALIYNITGTNTRNAEFQVLTSNHKIYGLHCRTLIPHIKQRIIDNTLPGLLARYEAGETLAFTETRVRGAYTEEIVRVCINQDGLRIRRGRKRPDEEINWGDLVAVTQKSDSMLNLMKRTDDKPVRLSLYGITNGCILKALLLIILSPANNAYQQIQIAE